MLWSVVLFLSSLRASSPFGRVMRIHASARGFAAHSRVPSQLASLSIIGGFARWLFPQDLINPELKIKWKRERMWPHFLFKCLVTRNQRICPSLQQFSHSIHSLIVNVHHLLLLLLLLLLFRSTWKIHLFLSVF